MHIGIVLAKVPGYSETFFNSKISGLLANGFKVSLFVQDVNDDFDLCPVLKAPAVHSNPIVFLISSLRVFLTLLPRYARILKFVRLERMAGSSWSLIFKIIYLNAHILKSDLDWLHFGFATQGLGRELLGKAIGARTAVSFRGFDLAIYPLKNKNCYLKLWDNLTTVHSISLDLHRLARDQGLPDKVPWALIPPAIDTAFFSTSMHPGKKLREPIQFLTVGRLNWKKGHSLMIEALAKLNKEGYNFNYTIVGSGSLKETERLKYIAKCFNMGDKVKFQGQKKRSEIKKIYESSDIYLQYSISEGFGNAVLEAQSMGLLCIVSDAEGLSENIINQVSGWVVPKLEPYLLAEKIKEVIGLSGKEHDSIRTRAIERIKFNFDIISQIQKFNEFYSRR